MKLKLQKFIDLFIESVNYIIISYALSNMAMLFQRNMLYILFFASEVWVMWNYWCKASEITKNKLISAVLIAACFLIHIGIVYFIGRIVGDIIPFKQ